MGRKERAFVLGVWVIALAFCFGSWLLIIKIVSEVIK